MATEAEDIVTASAEHPAGSTAGTGGSMDDTLGTRLAASLDGAELSDSALHDAARFLLAAGGQRMPGDAAIVVESVTGPVAERATRIAAINDDMPFLVDTIAATLAANGIAIDRLVHPILSVSRDATGALTAFGDHRSGGGKPESWVYIEAERIDARHRVKLRGSLAQALDDVHAAVRDWQPMQAAIAQDAAALADAAMLAGRADEPAALLRWLGEGKLTLLGHVLHYRDGSEDDALGICADGAHRLLSAASYRHAFDWFAADARRPLLIVKANHVSRVHRRVPLDLLIVPRFAKSTDGADVLEALSVHAGIWTSAALAAPPAEVPVLRRHLDAIMAESGYDPASHAGKALVHALTSLPHDMLIGFPREQLTRVAMTMISLLDRPRPHLTLVRAPLDRHLFAFVWLPRDALSSEVRRAALAMIAEAAGARLLDWTMEVDGALATIRAVLDLRESPAPIDEAALDLRLRAMVRGWPEAVEAALGETEAPGRAAAMASRFADAFPAGYRTAYGPVEAAADIRRLAALGDAAEHPGRGARLHCHAGCPEGEMRLKLYQRRGLLPLSDAVPMLENFGFRVVGETPTLLGENAAKFGAIHDFQLALPTGVTAAPLLARAGSIESAIAGVLTGGAENDAFNRLLAGVGLSAREANWLRALYRYMRQTGLNFGIGTVVDALVAAPVVARGLVDLFVSRHDPAFAGDRAEGQARAANAIRDGLTQVAAINDDRLLRRYQGVVEAIVRTNAFQPIVAGAPEIALAFKFDSTRVPMLPRPVPWREIFVHSRRVEGIHLRAGPIARGGLRWSDRRDDFRTEVLGLMKAQRVKNAVIVPTGAKGGFFPKHLPDPTRADTGGREGWMAEGTESYRLFVRSLLSLTDNIVGNTVVHPADTVIADGDDPYFVVAADKGTASFSDIANAIAAERDFWLDDAFASGGSKGYDHKAMAITARGAWLSVRRHFLELGTDVQSESVRVVGCGDMSGDVFGNGMLLSHAIKLVAAFDHRHIFLDPDPDCMRSHDERRRLFALPRSSWDDYDKSVLSKGGGIFPRSMKAIPLSPQVRRMLNLEAETADPETLIRAILTAQVDLLWFGGIGTYVKGTGETNAAVGDPANDTLRIDGREVRARVMGEGANLGATQAGRIEFALMGASGEGGRINTDFIDNSAGVDCSDNEVNIKIALASAKRAGRLTEDGRVELLGRMTDEVAALVLEDNRLQALALSIAEAGGTDALPAYLRLIDVLEQDGQIDRRGDGLADADTLSRRASGDIGAGAGLTRPELAVILSSAKLSLQAALEASPIGSDPLFDEELLAAFPATMRDDYREDILNHRLRHELVATKLANRIVNRMGLIHSFELIEEEGVSAAQFATAFLAAEHLFDMRTRWQEIETGVMPEPARIMLFGAAADALRPHIADLLRAGAGRIAPTPLIAGLDAGMQRLFACAAGTLGAETRAQSAQMRAELVATGAPAAEAGLVADLYDLDGAIGIARLAAQTGVDAGDLATAFVDLGARLGLDWAHGKAARMNPRDPWERLLVGGLARDFQQMRLHFFERVARAGADPRADVTCWASEEAPAVARFRGMVQRAQGAVAASPAMLAQLASQAKTLLET